MKKRLILFIAIFVITLLVGWSVYSFYAIVWNKLSNWNEMKQDLYRNAEINVVNSIIKIVDEKGEVIINFPSEKEGIPGRQVILINKVGLQQLNNLQNNEE